MIPIAHTEDQWLAPDGTHRPRHGQGRRWRVRYSDPAGGEHSRSFDRKTDADRFENTVAADLIRGQYTDPRAGKVTLRQYSAEWLAVQQFSSSTRETTEMRLRRHIYPV